MRRWHIWPEESFEEIEFFSVFRNISLSLKAVVLGIMLRRQIRKHPFGPQLCMNVVISTGWWGGVWVLEANYPELGTTVLPASCVQLWVSTYQDVVIMLISYLL